MCMHCVGRSSGGRLSLLNRVYGPDRISRVHAHQVGKYEAVGVTDPPLFDGTFRGMVDKNGTVKALDGTVKHALTGGGGVKQEGQEEAGEGGEGGGGGDNGRKKDGQSHDAKRVRRDGADDAGGGAGGATGGNVVEGEKVKQEDGAEGDKDEQKMDDDGEGNNDDEEAQVRMDGRVDGVIVAHIGRKGGRFEKEVARRTSSLQRLLRQLFFVHHRFSRCGGVDGGVILVCLLSSSF